jgi:hypothetical protein
MPIRINLLAETQATEELRRHDPVKRVIYCGAFLVALMLVWSSSLQLEAMLAKKEVSDRQTQIQAHTNQFQQVQSDQKQLSAVTEKLEALKQMADSRFLQGNLLNALQQVNVEGVQLLRIRVDQNYSYTPAARTQTNGNRVILGHPDSVREKIVILLDARDSSPNPGDQVNKFKDAIATEPYFKETLNKTNGVQLANQISAPQIGSDGKPFVTFTLQCNFLEKDR